jgi:hypothetical protein
MARSRYDAGVPAMRPRGRDRQSRCSRRDVDVSHDHDTRPAGVLLEGVRTGRRRDCGRCAVRRRAIRPHRAVYPPWFGGVALRRPPSEPSDSAATRAPDCRLSETSRWLRQPAFTARTQLTWNPYSSSRQQPTAEVEAGAVDIGRRGLSLTRIRVYGIRDTWHGDRAHFDGKGCDVPEVTYPYAIRGLAAC